ncbi:protein disulfide-isomerase precursor, partial [Mortierella alpina]
MRISAAIALVSLATTAMLVHASDVLSLTADTFKTSVSPEQKIILVDFYAPWCGHCQNLEPEYEAAATQLKEIGVPLAKVDCTTEKELCKQYEVTGYPTLKVFKAGVPKDYKGPRKTDGIVSYLKKHAAPPVTELTAETMPAFAASERVVVVAVLPKDSPMRAE